ncbi:MAG: tryptophan synthase subunit alpha [Pseudonocardia sp.]|nr:tryptophan synthase subunit alpha [Pseudonocardia sp.]
MVEGSLRARRDRGEPSLVPYVMAGVAPDWPDQVRACVDAGADAVEIGLPFSDPMLDGPVIQAASTRALARGVTVSGLLDEVAGISVDVPLVAMTYSNVVHRRGDAAFCRGLAETGIAGLIAPDTPLDEIDELRAAADAAPLELALLVAPITAPERAARVAERSRGFVYVVSNMGVTGGRSTVSGTVARTTATVRAATTLPVLVGFGISTPEQAAEVARHADGVIVASALVADVLDGADAAGVGRRVTRFRRGVDGGRGR